MRKLSLFAVLVGVFLVLGFFATVVHGSNSETSYREMLLNFYSQQLVARGAMLFAASAATFGFVVGLIGKIKKESSWSNIIFVLFARARKHKAFHTEYSLVEFCEKCGE